MQKIASHTFLLVIYSATLTLVSGFWGNAHAQQDGGFEVDLNAQLDASNFAKELTEVYSYKRFSQIQPVGQNQLDLSLNQSQITSRKQPSNKSRFQGLNLNAGISDKLNFGIQYQTEQNTSVSSFTGRIEYGLLTTASTKANIAIGGHYTTVNGLKTHELDVYGIDLGVSKTFFKVTPFANIGFSNSYVEPILDTDLSTEKTSLFQYSAGMNIHLLEDFDLSFGYNLSGDKDSYAIQAGYRF